MWGRVKLSRIILTDNGTDKTFSQQCSDNKLKDYVK